MAEKEQKEKKNSLIDQFIDLAATVRAYIRQETRRTVKDTIITPVDRLKNRAILAIIGAFAIGSGLIFFSVASFLLLAKILGSYWAAFGLVGLILLILGAIILRLMVKLK